jgi:hypothetical protein
MRIGELDQIVTQIDKDASAGLSDAVWTRVESLLRDQQGDEGTALALVAIVERGHLSVDKALTVLAEVHAAHSRNESVLGVLADALDKARDIDLLNDAPPEHPLFLNVVSALSDLSDKAKGGESEALLLQGLSTAARMMGRQKDDVVERCCRRLIELNPKASNLQYNFGLFLKTRGRFREGMIANQAAENLAGERPESYEWNLGICATGAGEGAEALRVWKRLGQKLEMGRFDLPDGSYPHCKVRLAQRPLAERSADSDDPGLEETIWIERLSPCHGIVRSVLYQDLGVDYGDVVLFDGAPITHHTYGDRQIAVFPHLATLVRHHYRLFDFGGTQKSKGQIADATDALERDAIVYAHSENFIQLCAKCWRNPEVDHEHHGVVEKHVVTGRIAAPADFDPRELLRQLDAAIAKRETCRIYVPDLCEAAGLSERAAFERRRFEMIRSG